MVFIKTGDQQGAKNCQHRSAPPESPVSDGHAVKRLSPTVEKSETDQSVTDKVAGPSELRDVSRPTVPGSGYRRATPTEGTAICWCSTPTW